MKSALFVPGYGDSSGGALGEQTTTKEDEGDDVVLFLIVGGGVLLAFLAGVAITCLLLVKRGSKLAPEWVEDYVEQKGLI